jgi:type I restriction enzyme M protein
MTAQIVQKLWNYGNVLGDDGMSYGDYPSAWLRTGSEQLKYSLLLKIAEKRTKALYIQPRR